MASCSQLDIDRECGSNTGNVVTEGLHEIALEMVVASYSKTEMLVYVHLDQGVKI